MYFQRIDGQILPTLSSPEIDSTVLTLAQAAEASGDSEDVLIRRWSATFGTIVPETNIDGEPVGAPRPAGASQVWNSMTASQRRNVVRLAFYPQLNEEFFEAFAETCEARKFSLLCRHLHPELRPDPTTGVPKLVIITLIDALRLISRRSGRIEGQIEHMWAADTGDWLDRWPIGPQKPAWARFGLHVAGYREPIWGKAAWEEYAPYLTDERGTKFLPDFWEKRPAAQLAKCAEAIAHRMASPEETSGIYIKEEMEKSGVDLKRRAGQRSTDDQRPRSEQPILLGGGWVEEQPEEDADLPEVQIESAEDFDAIVERCGYQTKVDREKMMRFYKVKYRNLWNANPGEFHNRVARELLAEQAKQERAKSSRQQALVAIGESD